MKIVELLMRESLPQKNFFHLAEVASLLDVKPHEIRYWESEFPQVRAQRSKSGQRNYRREDVLLFFAIKTLVYEKKLTVAGAQRLLAQADEHFFASMNDNYDKGVSPASMAVPIEELPYHEVAVITDHALLMNTHDVNQTLEEASQLFTGENDDDQEWDAHTHQIYQQCADDLDTASLYVEPYHVGEMLHDAIVLKEHADKNVHRLSQLDYEKACATLTQSKNALIHLLATLEKYRESTWWDGLKS